MRRLIALIASIALLAAPLSADVESTDISPQVDEAVSHGQTWLAREQNSDGSFDGGGPRVAMTGLALMAFLACGNAPGRGRYGQNVRQAIDFLLRQTTDGGYFGRIDSGRMYTHGIATLALAEAYGVEIDPPRRAALRVKLQQAIDVIFKAQDINKDPNNSGGWRYEPTSGDSDMSLSGWNALALRAAQAVGFNVPAERVQRAVGFVLKCYRPDDKAFGYQSGNPASPAMTGVALLNLYVMDAGDRPETAAGGEYLLSHPVTDDSRFPYYSTYYAAQGAHQAGGAVWSTVWKLTQARLLAEQEKEGSWPQSHSSEEPGRIYATTMALLTLSIPYRLLPVYQR